MKVTRITPIRIVERIEPLLDLWEGRLGFTRLVGVDDGDRLGFVLLAHGEQHVMLQTRRSLAADLPALAARDLSTVLYVDVTSLEDALRALDPATVLVPPRTTFYGAREVAVHDGAGGVLVFAEHPERAS